MAGNRLIINKLGYFHNVTFFCLLCRLCRGGRPLFGYSQGLIHFSQKFLFFIFLFSRCDVVCLFVCYYSFPLLALTYYALIYSYLQYFDYWPYVSIYIVHLQ